MNMYLDTRNPLKAISVVLEICFVLLRLRVTETDLKQKSARKHIIRNRFLTMNGTHRVLAHLCLLFFPSSARGEGLHLGTEAHFIRGI